jgi:hypothetical protein
VVVTARAKGTYILSAHVKHHRLLVAEGQVYLRRPGAKHAWLTLTSSGRRVVQGRSRLRVRVTASHFPFEEHEAAATAVLGR